MSDPTTGSRSIGWWPFLTAIIAVVVGVLSAGATSAAALPELGNRVGASTAVVVNIVGPHESIAAGQRWGNAPPQVETAVATGVAANAGEDAVQVFRVHGPEETADILGSGVYRNPPGLEGKYFYPTRAQAENLGGMYSKAGIGGPYSVSSGTVARTVLNQAERIAPAGEGPAFFLRNDLLSNITNVTVHGPL
jgi:hypothetical protein